MGMQTTPSNGCSRRAPRDGLDNGHRKSLIISIVCTSWSKTKRRKNRDRSDRGSAGQSKESVFNAQRLFGLATAYVMLADPLSSYVSGATIAVTGGKPIL
jgi:hypothetical protein